MHSKDQELPYLPLEGLEPELDAAQRHNRATTLPAGAHRSQRVSSRSGDRTLVSPSERAWLLEQADCLERLASLVRYRAEHGFPSRASKEQAEESLPRGLDILASSMPQVKPTAEALVLAVLRAYDFAMLVRTTEDEAKAAPPGRRGDAARARWKAMVSSFEGSTVDILALVDPVSSGLEQNLRRAGLLYTVRHGRRDGAGSSRHESVLRNAVEYLLDRDLDGKRRTREWLGDGPVIRARTVKGRGEDERAGGIWDVALDLELTDASMESFIREVRDRLKKRKIQLPR